MQLQRFQDFYLQLVSLLENELAIDKEKLSMILHSHVTEETIDTLLREIANIYQASSIELWFLDKTYNRYYLFDPSISIPHVFRSMTRSLSRFHFDNFFKYQLDASSSEFVSFKTKDSFIFQNRIHEESVIAIPLDDHQSGVIFVMNPNKTLNMNFVNDIIKQNSSLIANLLFTDDIDFSPYLLMEPSINISALKAFEKLYDSQTYEHEEKVSRLSKAIASNFKFPSYTIDRITIASKMHDIGKLFIPRTILKKGNALTAEDITILQTHITLGTEILSLLGFSQDVIKLVYEHHERMDGSGFPQKLKNYQFTLESQIIAISDELSVLVSKDDHHEKTSDATSIFELVQYKGIRYSAELIDTIEQMIKDKTLLPLLR